MSYSWGEADQIGFLSTKLEAEKPDSHGLLMEDEAWI